MIVIINAPGITRRGQKARLPYASSVVVSHLREHGFDVTHRDLFCTVSVELGTRVGRDDVYAWLYEGVRSQGLELFLERCLGTLPPLEGCSLVGISVVAWRNIAFALALARELKRLHPELPICLGGTYVTLLGERAVECATDVDYLVRGHAGEAILRLAEHLEHGEPLDESVPGLLRCTGNVTPEPGVSSHPIEAEAAPDFSDLDLEAYRGAHWLVEEEVLDIPYRLSSGCVQRCSFCTGRQVERYQFKSVDKATRELSRLTRLDPRPLIFLCDAAINNNPKLLGAFMDAMRSQVPSLRFIAMIKAAGIDEATIDSLASAGCVGLYWGLDAIGPNTKRVLRKAYSLPRAEICIRHSAALGISNQIGIMFNGPGETEDDLRATEALVRRMSAVDRVEFVFTPFRLEPFSDLYEEAESNGIEVLEGLPRAEDTPPAHYAWRERSRSRVDQEALHALRRLRIGQLETSARLAARVSHHGKAWAPLARTVFEAMMHTRPAWRVPWRLIDRYRSRR